MPSHDQLVGVPGLAVVGEVGALDGLELHPQVAVVVLDHVARGGRTGDDDAAPLGGEDRGPHGLAARVLEDDVGVVAHQGPDVLAQPAPLRLVLGVLVLPEPVAGRLAVDDRLDPEVVEELHLLRRGDHPDGDAAAVQDVLDGVGAEAARGAPDEHPVALFHRGAVARHEHPVGGRVAQGVDGRLLPGQVGRLGHELVGLDHGQVGQAAEVGLEAPDPLVGGQHGVVVGRRVLVVDVVAVDGDACRRASSCGPPSRPAAPRRRRRSRPRGTAGRGGRPRRSPCPGGRGTRRWGAARRSRSRRC